MNRHLTCLFSTGLLWAAPAVLALAPPAATRPGWRVMTDTIRTDKSGWLLVTGDIQALKSTHDNYFLGGSIAAVHPFTRTFELGLGAEVSHARYHADNGWQLYNLYFLPLVVVTRFNLIHTVKSTVYLHVAQGNTRSHYQKQDVMASGTPYRVVDYGYYTYAGGGIRWQAFRHALVQAEMGIKLFHLSTNKLAVNPHGLTLRLGVTVH